MAQITEFLINLLLLRRNFLTLTAADTIREAVKKCMNYKRKISIEYANALQMVGPFDNMLEFINYAASQYTSEGENYVVTSQVQCKLYEELTKLASPEAVISYKEENKNENRPSTDLLGQVNMVLANPTINEKVKITEKGKNFSTSSNLMRRDDDQNDGRKIKNQNYIIDNLHGILKSQELLFKNIIKLIHILEKDAKLNINAKKLEQIRNKLRTCTDVLSQNSLTSQKFSDLINNIIEEEITRCRFRHGEGKTSREISLKIPKPEGIAAALEPSKKNSVIIRKSKEDENNKEDKKEAKPSIIKLDREKETFNRNEIESEIKKKSAKFIKEEIPKVIKIDRLNEILRRNEMEEEIKKYSMNLIKQPKIIKLNRQNEILCRHKIDSEARRHSNNFIKRAKSEPTMSFAVKPNINNENKMQKYSTSAVFESKKLIEMNEEHFHQFENALWHSLTTTKFMSIKDDYQNKNKCAFYNKKQFLAFESALSKRSKEREENDKIEKFLSISESMFQILERKLFFDDLKQKVKGMNPESINKPETRLVKPAPDNKENHAEKFSTREDKSDKIKNKDINVKQKQAEGKEKSNFDQVLSTLKENIAASTPSNKAKITVKRPDIIPRPVQNNSSKINTAIKEKNLEISQKNPVLSKKERNLDKAAKTRHVKETKNSEASVSEKNILTTTEHGKIIIDNYKIVRNKAEEKRSVKTIKETTKYKQSVDSALEKRKEKTKNEIQISAADDKKVKNQEFTGLEVKLNLYNIIKNTANLKNRQECLALQVVANPDGKLLNIQGKVPTEQKAPKKSLSDVQLKDEAALIEMNKKAFDEMENTLHTVRNFINKHPVIIKSSTSLKRAGNKHTPDESTKKNLSTKAFITVTSQSLCNCNKMTKRKTHILSKGDGDEAQTPVSAGKTFVKENVQSESSEESKSDADIKYLYNEKSRTFLKSATQQFVETRRLKHTLAVPITKISSDKLLQMRRTTKSVMKKQQVLTLLPKLSTTNYKRKQSKEWLLEKKESKITKSNKYDENIDIKKDYHKLTKNKVTAIPFLTKNYEQCRW